MNDPTALDDSQPRSEKILVANRGEIAVRICRTAQELNLKSVAIYAYEDRYSGHMKIADEAYQIGLPEEFDAIGAYLQIDRIVEIARRTGATLVHPGYGFLAENKSFAQVVRKAGIRFIGPSERALEIFGDKVKARDAAVKCGIPVVPGTTGPVTRAHEVRDFVEKHGYPILIKAAFGGGGRGMRVVHDTASLIESLKSAQSEAEKAFGNGAVFAEKYLAHPKHIEVQVLGDYFGNVIHLFERDCSLQRKHQKIVEIAPAPNLDPNLRNKILEAAVQLARSVGYVNAGTVEFLVYEKEFFFIEMNPRIQVEHTITEEITGMDLVAAQIQIACGRSLPELGLTQDQIHPRGSSIQCRITTEIPSQEFRPDIGKIEAYRIPTGPGVRLDSASLHLSSLITPYYDSLLVKCICNGGNFQLARKRSIRALTEFGISGVETNVSFLLEILKNPLFASGDCWTTFIEQSLKSLSTSSLGDEMQKMLRYLGEAAVNGSAIDGQVRDPAISKPIEIQPLRDPLTTQTIDTSKPCESGWRNILIQKGPRAFADAVRAHKKTLITDTTWRDGQQSLLATRIRTKDFEAIAHHTSHVYAKAYSIECWGGATFDVTMRFLHEDPWERLRKFRKLIPNIPFQMLLRSTNGVAYSALPDNAIFHFVKTAKDNGIDIFRIFDGLNDVYNMEVGIRAILAAGGLVEGSILYTGDMLKPGNKYTLQYYMGLVDKLVEFGSHIIAFKSMSGVLKPKAASIIVRAVRAKYPEIPIHMHSHDNNGVAVATMMACADAGADIVDTAIDSISGTTSQPGISSVLAALENTGHDAEINLNQVRVIDDYWSQVRLLYAGFDSDLRSPDPDVYLHEIPGGQYSNLLFQARQLGLGSRWVETKQAYIDANIVLGDIIKATPTSKAVGDLAQFMVDRGLSATDIQRDAANLDLPLSVIEYCQGLMGQPFDGFPQPFRTDVLRRAHRDPIDCRPGLILKPVDFDNIRKTLETQYPGQIITDCDIDSHIMYPDVYAQFRRTIAKYGDLSTLPTDVFLTSPKMGKSFTVQAPNGCKTHIINMTSIGDVNSNTGKREVYFELDGELRFVSVIDKSAVVQEQRKKADAAVPGEIGASMHANVVRIKVQVGDIVKAGDSLLTLSAMKMEVTVSAIVGGVIEEVLITEGDVVQKDDLLVKIGSN